MLNEPELNEMELLTLFPEFRLENNEKMVIGVEIENFLDMFTDDLKYGYHVTSNRITIFIFSDKFSQSKLEFIRSGLWDVCQEFNETGNNYKIAIGILDIKHNCK